MSTPQDIPYGYCHCGCGQKTKLAPRTNAAQGRVKGDPIRFVDGHQGNGRPPAPIMQRLWAKVDKRGADECWPFRGSRARGYGRIGLGSRTAGTTNAHRVICEAVHGPAPEPNQQARHLCGNRACCNPAHIAWGNQSDNEMDKVGHGRSNRGEQSGHARLTRDQVRSIRAELVVGLSMHAIADEYGVAWQTIQDIAHRRTWRWLDNTEGGDAE